MLTLFLRDARETHVVSRVVRVQQSRDAHFVVRLWQAAEGYVSILLAEASWLVLVGGEKEAAEEEGGGRMRGRKEEKGGGGGKRRS